MLQKLLWLHILAIAISTQLPLEVDAAKWKGMCTSTVTGIHLGWVYGSNQNELNHECSKKAINFIVTNINEEPCAVGDSFPGCEAGTAIDITPCNGSHAPDNAFRPKSGPTQISERATGRSCVFVPKVTKVTASYCAVYSSSQGRHESGTHFCGYDTGAYVSA